MRSRSIRLAAVSMTAVLALAGAACSDDDDGGDSSADTQATTTEPGGATTDVTGVDYAFEGVPETLPAGPHTFTFANEGEEPHELVIFRIVDENDTLEDLLALPEAEAESRVEEAGGTFALPGEEGEPAEVELEAGKYAFVCFIPVGTTGETPEETGDGPPHFTEGMATEFTVG
jgi:hypothetical protein